MVMRLQVRFIFSFVAVAALALNAGARAQAQSQVQSPSGQATPNGAYIAVDPLANVRYDNRYDLSLGFAYDHMKAGPDVLQGANLGGLDVEGSYWLTRRWGVEGSGRAYLGSSGVGQPTPLPIKGPFVAQYMFLGGPEWLGPHNKHGDLIAHVLVGGVYGDFTKDLLGYPSSVVAFYNNQIAPAAVFGGHFDLNRSQHWVFRVTTDAVFTRYNANFATPNTPIGGRVNWNPAVSVGILYKFKKKR